MAELLKVEAPRAEWKDVHRLSENGDGAVQWGLETDYNLSEVKVPGFFRLIGQHGLKKHDRIYAVCRQHESVVTHATLVVTVERAGRTIEVAQLGESYEVEIGTMSAFERLGIPVSANKTDISNAFKERAKRLDKGDEMAMQALDKALDEAMLIAEHKELAS